MKSPDGPVAIVREWVAKAENDLLNAAHTLRLGPRCPTDTVCFHAQQCVEKYVKALLAFRKLEFPRTHDLEALVTRLRNGPTLSPGDLTRLTRYATVTRYPGADEIPLGEARQAVAAARRMRKAIRRFLPPSSVRARRAQK